MARNASGNKSSTERVERPFPRALLDEALRVPRAIRDGNGGKPWDGDQVAKALNIAPKSSNLNYLLAASADFGFTNGKSPVGQILTELGKEAVYPSSAESETAALRQAFMRVDVFKKVLEHYGGDNLPERQFWITHSRRTSAYTPRCSTNSSSYSRRTAALQRLGKISRQVAPWRRTVKRARPLFPLVPRSPRILHLRPQVSSLARLYNRAPTSFKRRSLNRGAFQRPWELAMPVKPFSRRRAGLENYR
jgi:hypothetical protein